MCPYEIVDTPPSLGDYLRLRIEAGLSARTAEQGKAAIAGTWAFRRAISTDGETVAMGRVIGDGGWYFMVADMATLPAHQGRGLGRQILNGLLEAIRVDTPGSAYVTLTADPPGRRLYESQGFTDVASGGQTGMFLVLED